MYLMAIDTAVTTEFDYTTNKDARLIELYSDKPELMDYRMGSVHSHNSMSAFFSGTDDTELKDGSKSSDMYLMLIVNNKDYTHWVARIGIAAKVVKTISSTFTFYNGKILKRNSNVDEHAYFHYDLDITINSDITKSIEEVDAQIKVVEELNKANTKPYTTGSYNNWKTGDNYGDSYGDSYGAGYGEWGNTAGYKHYPAKTEPKQYELWETTQPTVTIPEIRNFLSIYTTENNKAITTKEIIETEIEFINAYLGGDQDLKTVVESYVDDVMRGIIEVCDTHAKFNDKKFESIITEMIRLLDNYADDIIKAVSNEIKTESKFYTKTT